MATQVRELVRDRAFLIRSTDYGDDHLILSLLTSEHGRVELIARSAKKSLKRFVGSLDFLQVMECEFKPNPHGGLATLTQCHVQEVFEEVREDYSLSIFALQWTKLLSQAVQQGQNVSGLFMLLRDNLACLRLGEIFFRDLSFRYHLLSLLGYHLDFALCARCRENIGGNCRLYPEDGGVLCGDCDASHRGFELEIQVVKLLSGDVPSQSVEKTSYDKALHSLQKCFQSLLGIEFGDIDFNFPSML